MRDIASNSRLLYNFSDIFTIYHLCGSHFIFMANDWYVACYFSVAVIKKKNSHQKHLKDRED